MTIHFYFSYFCSQFPGVQDFVFSMEELTAANNGNPIYDHEIYVEAQVFDWFRSQPAKGSAITVVYSNIVQLKVLGDKARTFKPGQPMDVYVR